MWTDEKINAAIMILEQSSTVGEASRKIGVSIRRLFNVFSESGYPTPGSFLKQRPKAKPPEPPEPPGYDKILVAGDFHVPHQHPGAVQAFLDRISSFKPQLIVINGDLLDAGMLSKFSKAPTTPLLEEELTAAKQILSAVRAKAPDAEIWFLAGNHEFRLLRYLEDHPGFYGLSALNIPNLLDLKDMKIQYKPYGELLIRGGMAFYHGRKVSMHAAYTAKAELELTRHKGFLFTGHTHRVGMTSRTEPDGTLTQAWECGCLCDPSKAGYMATSPLINWAVGWIEVEGRTATFRAFADQVGTVGVVG